MKIALYGSDKGALASEREGIVNSLANSKTQQEIEVYCIQDEKELKQNLMDYQIVLMEMDGIREFKKCVSRERGRKKITISAGKGMGVFYVDDIFYVEAELSKTHFVTGSEEFVMALTITEAEKLLEEDGFIKIHRSYLVNASHIKEIKRRTAILDNGKELPISKYRMQQVRMRYLEIVEDAERFERE